MLPFWETLGSFNDAIALVDCESETTWTYKGLDARARRAADLLRGRDRRLILLLAENDVGAIVWYLAALLAGHAVFLSVARERSARVAALVESYRPDVIVRRASPASELPAGYAVTDEECEYEVLRRASSEAEHLHPALALVLSTSASTGSAKCVRLSASNVAASASQVVNALAMEPSDRALLALPISYVYGLSVVNSTLFSGGSLVLANGSFADRTFWSRIDRTGFTTLAVVSQMLEFMRHLDIDRSQLPNLRRLTHSGEALEAGLFLWAHENFCRHGVDLYLMYGQTEACGRITVLPPSALPAARGSVGRAVPGGSISIEGHGGIRYRGPGVMMGYAFSRTDLGRGDELQSVLDTGDLGHLDEQGNLYITGRASRHCKILGRRVSLDDIEAIVREGRPVAAVEKAGRVLIFIEGDVPPSMSVLRIAQRLRLPPQAFQLRPIRSLPRTLRGKIAYAELASLA